MSNRIRELQDRQNAILAEARERLDQITATTEEARAAELERQHDAAMAEHDRLGKAIEREQRVAAAEAAAEARSEEERAKMRPRPGDTTAPAKDEPSKGDISYRSVFHKFIAKGGSLDALSTEERAVLSTGGVEGRAQTVGTATAGGHLVPTELADQIIVSMKAWGPMYNSDVCTVIDTASGNSIKIPTVDDTATTAVAHTEGAALTDTGAKDVSLGQKSLDSYVFDTQFVRWSMELQSDSMFSVELLLAQLLGERLGRIANAQLTTGTGTSAPNGIVTASSLGKAAASATAITADEIIDLLHSVDPAYRASPKVRFMFNDSVLAAVRKLKDGQGNYLWQMGDVTRGEPGRLLGYRYEVNQAMDSLATAKKVMLFGDMGKYFVRRVGPPAIGVLRERFWPDLGIAGLIRFDGEHGDAAAVKHLLTA